jgi:hypothetical protein
VPKSLHSSQSSSSAPSTLTVVSDDLDAPHISHWGIPIHSRAHRIKGAPAATAPDRHLTSGRTTHPRTAGAR